MARQKIADKRVMTINMISTDIDIATALASARGVSAASVIREAVRVGLPLLIERDLVYMTQLQASALAKSLAPTDRSVKKMTPETV